MLRPGGEASERAGRAAAARPELVLRSGTGGRAAPHREPGVPGTLRLSCPPPRALCPGARRLRRAAGGQVGEWSLAL